jgi:hypothetical protein
VVGAAFAAIGLAGCTHLSVEVGIPLAVDGEPFLAGKAHYGEVLKRMGPPAMIASRSGGFTFLYEYARVAEKQLSLSPTGDESPVPQIFNLVTATAQAHRETYLLQFDSEGVLRSQRHDSRDEALGGGVGLQLFVDVSNIVDTEGHRRAPPQHGWGRALLDRLPEALNRRHGGRDGTGLSLLGAPDGIGQETLDMQHDRRSQRR